LIVHFNILFHDHYLGLVLTWALRNLDRNLHVGPGLKKNDLLQAMEGHVVGKAVLMGTFKR